MNDGLQHNDQASAQFACPCGACQSYYIDQIHRADALGIFPGLTALIISRGGLSEWDLPQYLQWRVCNV